MTHAEHVNILLIKKIIIKNENVWWSQVYLELNTIMVRLFFLDGIHPNPRHTYMVMGGGAQIKN